MNKKVLWNVSALAGAVIIVLATTMLRQQPIPVPQDEKHRPLIEMLAGGAPSDAVNRQCPDCHNPEQNPFPAEHPSGEKCLACHPAFR